MEIKKEQESKELTFKPKLTAKPMGAKSKFMQYLTEKPEKPEEQVKKQKSLHKAPKVQAKGVSEYIDRMKNIHKNKELQKKYEDKVVRGQRYTKEKL